MIQSFLDTVRAEDELNRMAIIGYCTQQGISITFDNTDPELELITLERFTRWLNRDELKKGDVACHLAHKIVGIVKSADLWSLTIVIPVDVEGSFSTEERVVPCEECRSATDEEKVEIQRLISQNGKAWDTREGRFVDPYHPRNNNLIKISLLDKRVGYGVFREFDSQGNAVMYCVKMSGTPVRFSLNEVIGNMHDYQYHSISTYDRIMLAKELAEIGKKWNGHAKRIEPLELRVAPGETYFFIDDCFDVRATKDKEKNKDKVRAFSGNYFRSQEDAMEIRDKLIEMRNEQFLRPETLKRKRGRPKKVEPSK